MRSKKRTYVPEYTTAAATDRVPAYEGLYILDINANYDGRDAERLMQVMNDFYAAMRASVPVLIEDAVKTLENIAQRQLMIATHRAKDAAKAEREVTRLQGFIDSMITARAEDDDHTARRDRAEAREERRTVALETLALEQMAANARAREAQQYHVVSNFSVFNTPGADEECGCQ